jgi:hypothetical protein
VCTQPRRPAQSRCDKAAAMRLMRELIKNQGMAPLEIMTDRLKS